MTDNYFGKGWVRVGGVDVAPGQDAARDLLEAAGEAETLGQVDQLTTIVEAKSEAGELTPAQAVEALGALERAYRRLQPGAETKAPARVIEFGRAVPGAKVLR